MSETTDLPTNPFTELPASGNRRTLAYEADIMLPNAKGKRVPMQLWEGDLLFPAVYQLFQRCKRLEELLEESRRPPLAGMDSGEVRHEKRKRA